MRLIVIRHAKAGEAASDMQRPLGDRGFRDAAGIGQWLQDRGVTVDRVVVSPALRAQQTWREAARRLHDQPEPTVDERVYANEAELLFDIVRETPAGVGTLVLVGHNPSCGALAADLDDGDGDAQARQDLRAGFPTSAVAVFEVAEPWSAVAPRRGTLAAFAAPRG